MALNMHLSNFNFEWYLILFGYRIFRLVDEFLLFCFWFSTLKMLFHCHSASILSDEKSVTTHIIVLETACSMYVLIYVAFNTFLLSLGPWIIVLAESLKFLSHYSL